MGKGEMKLSLLADDVKTLQTLPKKSFRTNEFSKVTG